MEPNHSERTYEQQPAGDKETLSTLVCAGTGTSRESVKFNYNSGNTVRTRKLTTIDHALTPISSGLKPDLKYILYICRKKCQLHEQSKEKS